ncbi:MAG: branched-chain amino acid ABC transporter substrate-binding protein [Anaerolineae bacterium]|nr:MAG: branched-chain amino acid ABC transporter substrate-binding protein [Anaerolineae bacterium]
MFQHKCLVLLLLAAVLLAGCRPTPPPFECTDAIGCVEIAPGAPIKIGALQVQSGDMGPQGLDMLQCTELAVKDQDRKLLGHPIELQSADSLCSGEGGTTTALKVAADPQIVGIVGPTCSGAAASAMKVVSETGLVMISSSSSAPSLTSVAGELGSNWQPGFFRTAQNDALVGRVAATFAFQQLGVRVAATINDGDPYTRGLTDTFEGVFTELGGQVVLATAVNKGDTDMRPVLTAVAASGAELVFFPVFRMEGDYIVLQAREMEGLEHVTLMSAEGLYFDAFIQAVGEAGAGMYFNTPTRPEGPAYDAFVSRYETEFNEPPTSTPYLPHTYDAVNVLLNAIEAAAVQEVDGSLHIGRQALRDALYATSGYQGLTGSLTCDEYGDCGAIRLQVARLDDPAAGLAGLAANVVYTYPPGQ